MGSTTAISPQPDRPSAAARWAANLLVAAVVAAASITAMEALVALAGLAWLLSGTALRPGGRSLLATFGLLGAWSVVSALFSVDPRFSLGASAGSLLWAAAPMGAQLLAGSRRELVRALLLAQAGIAGVWALCEWLFWWNGDPLARVSGPFSGHMTLAGFLLIALLQALPRPGLGALFPGGRGRAHAWALGRAAFALGVGGLLVTLTRSSLLALVAGAAALFWTSEMEPARRRLATAAAVMLVVAGLLVAVWAPRLAGESGPRTEAAAASTRDRLALWSAGLEMIRAHPIAGIGANRVRRESHRFVPAGHRRPAPPSHLHSAPLTLAVERGVPALLLAVAIYVLTLRRFATGPRSALRRGALAAVVGFLVMGLFEDNFDDAEVLFIHLVTLSAIWAPPRAGGGPRVP